MSGTGIDAVPNIPKCPVPVLIICRTELAEVFTTGISIVPNLAKCPVPAIPVVCVGTYLAVPKTALNVFFLRSPSYSCCFTFWHFVSTELLRIGKVRPWGRKTPLGIFSACSRHHPAGFIHIFTRSRHATQAHQHTEGATELSATRSTADCSYRPFLVCFLGKVYIFILFID